MALQFQLSNTPGATDYPFYNYSGTDIPAFVAVQADAVNVLGTGANYAIGVAFTGKKPPSDYIDHPSRLYDISHREQEGEGFWHLAPADLLADDSDLPKDLRKQTRLFIPETLKIELMDEAGNVTASETTVTENLSIGGAAVFTQFDLEAGSFLRVTSERFNVTIISVVRGKRVGPDGITRLHLEFIDKHFPLQGFE